MHRVLTLLPLVVLLGACSSYRLANGTVSYTSTPPTAEHSGALPLSLLVCVDNQTNHHRPDTAIEIGNKCVLWGHFAAHTGKYAIKGGEGNLVSAGVCELPTLSGPLPLHVDNATLHVVYESVDVTIGGTTSDGRYTTYRFTGNYGEEDQTRACPDLLKNAPDLGFANFR